MASIQRACRFGLCAFAVVAGVIGCSSRDVSDKPEFAAMIGREYRVIGDVDAYGIKLDLQDKDVSYVTLIPPPGIGGPEVAFERRLPKGQVFRIKSAMWQFKPFDNGTEYLIELEDSDLPRGIEVRLELFRGNESGDTDLNPRLYARLAK